MRRISAWDIRVCLLLAVCRKAFCLSLAKSVSLSIYPIRMFPSQFYSVRARPFRSHVACSFVIMGTRIKRNRPVIRQLNAATFYMHRIVLYCPVTLSRRQLSKISLCRRETSARVCARMKSCKTNSHDDSSRAENKEREESGSICMLALSPSIFHIRGFEHVHIQTPSWNNSRRERVRAYSPKYTAWLSFPRTYFQQ